MSTKTKATTPDAGVIPPADATTTIGGASAIPNGMGPIGDPINDKQAPSLFAVLQGMKSSSKLDTAALDYIDAINRIFNDSHEGITALPISTDKCEARAFIHNASRACINLIFAETHSSLDMTPAALRAGDVYNAVLAQDRTAQVIQTIVVTPADYALAGQMAAYISNCFKTIGGGDAGALTVDNLRGMKISVITNIDMVRSYIRQVSPHAVPSRDDIGVLLCLEYKTQSATGYGQDVEQRPFLAVTGYTRIMNPQDAATGVKFVPIPTITDVVSSIPNPSLLAMALPIAADAFIVQNLWTRPYTTFRTGMPNLGNLIQDPASKKPLFTDTVDAFHNFVRTYMFQPYLAIDITEGRARPLGIDSLIQNQKVVFGNIANFLRMPEMNLDVRSPILMAFSNFTGTFMDKGAVKDTRCVDYLDLAAKVTDHKQIEHLLLQPNQPQVKIEAVRGIYPENTKSLYLTTTLILDAVAVSTMSKGLADARVNLSYDMPASGNFNLTGMLAFQNGNSFTGYSAIATGFGRQNFVPGGFGSNMYANLI